MNVIDEPCFVLAPFAAQAGLGRRNGGMHEGGTAAMSAGMGGEMTP